MENNHLKNVRNLVSSLLEDESIRIEIIKQTTQKKAHCTHEWGFISYSETLGNRCVCSKCGEFNYIAQGYF